MSKIKNIVAITKWFPSKGTTFSSPFVYETVTHIGKYVKNEFVYSMVPFIPQFLRRKSFLNMMGLKERWHGDILSKNYGMNYSIRNIHIKYIKSIPFWGSLNNTFEINRSINKMKMDIVKQHISPNLIHAHFTWPSGYAAVKLGRQFNVPVVITAHGYDVYDLPFRNEKWFDKIKFTLDNSDHIITVSKSNFRILTEKLGVPKDEIAIIPNGFDSKIFKEVPHQQARKELGIPSNKKILLTVGNIVEIKGHKYLVNALEKVVDIEKDILLIIVGSGPLEDKIRNLIRKLNLQNHVWMVGAKPHSEIPLWMNAADLFVLPSLRESFGIVQIEAMAVGTPVVATINGGSEEIIISEKYGFLCPPADADCLAEKILIGLEREWDREKIMEYAKRFTWDNVAKEILKVYDKIV